MDLTVLIAKAHGGMGMLLLLLAITSLGMAVKSIISSRSEGFLKVANITGLLETIIAGIVTLTGIVAIFTSPWPISQLWIWIGLIIMVVYSIFLKRLTKPARLAVADGGSASKWAGLQIVHIVLVVVAFALMRLKPF